MLTGGGARPDGRPEGPTVSVALRGLGGSGKTTLMAALARHPRLLVAFEAAAWVTVGETPDIPRLQRSLMAQYGEADSACSDADLPAKMQRLTRGRRLLL